MFYAQCDGWKKRCMLSWICGTIGGVEDNYGKPPNSIVHGNISNVENVHMQVVTTHFWTTRTYSIITTDCVEVEVMQLAIIQIQLVA